MKRRLAEATLGVLVLLFLAFAIAVPASGQGRAPEVLAGAQVNLPVQFDVSPPLSEMAAQAGSQAAAHAPVVMRPKEKLLNAVAAQGGRPAPDGALQTTTGPLVNTTIGLNLLGVGTGFPNYTVPDAPSDVNLAVGDTQVVQWVNVSYAIFDKATGAILAGPVAGNAFWSGFGGTCQTSNSGDMIAQWDKIAHRWVMTQPVFSSPYKTCIAISTTADATGTYFRFAFPQSAGFPDYPKWGLMPDAYYQSQNVFNSSGTAFLGVNVCAYERAKLLAGDATAKQVCILDNSNGTLFDDSMLPADLDSASNPPPAGQDEVLLGSIDNSIPETHVYKYLFHADFTNTANSTLTGVNGSMPIAVSTFSLACNGGACVTQPSTSWKLDSLGDRLMYRLAYRNFGDHQTWLVSHSVTAGTSTGERWYEFQAPSNSTSLSVYQQGTFAPDSDYRWMGSIAMDQNQNIALGYSRSGGSTFPSIYYTGRAATDALGTMQSEGLIFAGTGSQTGTSNRWGDYTSMAIDAADDCTFWYTNQYYTTTSQFNWSTRLASFKFAGCGGSGGGGGTPPSAPALQTPTALNTFQVSLSWSEAGGQNQTGFNIYRCTGSLCTPTTKIASVGNVTTYTDGSSSTPLSENTFYSYAVTAVSSGGESGPSATKSVSTPSEPAPTNLTSSSQRNGRGKKSKVTVSLAWTNNSTDADGVRVERCAGTGCSNFAEIATTGATATSYTDSNVALQTTYSYRVRAHSPGGFSVYSNTTTVTTP